MQSPCASTSSSGSRPTWLRRRRAMATLPRLSLMVTLATIATLPLAGTAGAAAAAAAKHHKAKHHKPKHKRHHRGSTKPTAKGHAITITGGSVTLAFTSAAWSKLDHSLGSTFTDTTTPVEPATATSTGTFTFPVTGGSLNSATGQGSVKASGGITVTSSTNLGALGSSGNTATATNPVVAIGSSSTVTMTSEQFSPSTVPLFDLKTGSIKPAVTGGTVTLSGIPVMLTSPGEQLFSTVGSFTTTEEIGTLTIAATS